MHTTKTFNNGCQYIAYMKKKKNGARVMFYHIKSNNNISHVLFTHMQHCYNLTWLHISHLFNKFIIMTV